MDAAGDDDAGQAAAAIHAIACLRVRRLAIRNIPLASAGWTPPYPAVADSARVGARLYQRMRASICSIAWSSPRKLNLVEKSRRVSRYMKVDANFIAIRLEPKGQKAVTVID